MAEMASQDNYHPFRFDSKTGEYYLPLPAPHSNIRLTAPRLAGDPDIQVVHMNDPRVYQNISGPPFPYLREHAEAWTSGAHAESQRLFEAIERGDKYIDGCPVRAIREVHEDGSDTLIGDLGVYREAPDVPWLEEGEKDNYLKPVGDPTIVWLVGCKLSPILAMILSQKPGIIDYLEPGHHRRGIMSLALNTLISEWMIPRMNCHGITGTTLIGNSASSKVLLNNGFVQLEKDILEWAPIPEGRGGGKMGLHIFRWSLSKSRDEKD